MATTTGYQTRARYAIGLDLGGTDLKSALVAEDGAVAAFDRRGSRVLENAVAPFEAMAEAVGSLHERVLGRLVGVGLGSPGVIDPASGVLRGATPHLPHWRDVALRETLRLRIGLPLVVDNDANLAALAEHRAGAARGARLSLTITLGTGVGCGIVADGRVLHGAFGGAGEIGHLPLGTGEVPCACGVPGCIEPEASGSGLVEGARRAGLDVTEAAAVFERLAAGDRVARGLVERMADRLGRTIASAVTMLNPDVVVVGGGVAQAGAPLLDPVRAAVARYALESHRAGLEVVPAELGERAGVVGAGLLAWDASREPARVAG